MCKMDSERRAHAEYTKRTQIIHYDLAVDELICTTVYALGFDLDTTQLLSHLKHARRTFRSEMNKLHPDDQLKGKNYISNVEILTHANNILQSAAPGYDSEKDIAEEKKKGATNKMGDKYTLQTKNVRGPGQKRKLRESHIETAAEMYRGNKKKKSPQTEQNQDADPTALSSNPIVQVENTPAPKAAASGSQMVQAENTPPPKAAALANQMVQVENPPPPKEAASADSKLNQICARFAAAASDTESIPE